MRRLLDKYHLDRYKVYNFASELAQMSPTEHPQGADTRVERCVLLWTVLCMMLHCCNVLPLRTFHRIGLSLSNQNVFRHSILFALVMPIYFSLLLIALYHRRYPFTDDTCPPLESVVDFCENAKAWLDAHEENVVSLHCKAGKGRAGIMAACLMVRMGEAAQTAVHSYEAVRSGQLLH